MKAAYQLKAFFKASHHQAGMPVTMFFFFNIILLLVPGLLSAANDLTIKPSVQGYIHVNIQFKGAKPGDTLTLAIDDRLHVSPLQSIFGSYIAVAHDGRFIFNIPVKHNCGYFDILKTRTFTKNGGGGDKMIVMESYFWEMGDNITVQLANKESYTGIYSQCSFSGKGTAKYVLKDLTDSILNNSKSMPNPTFDSVFNYFDFWRFKCQKALDVLEENRSKLTDLSYQVLKANILFSTSKGRFSLVLDYYNQFIKNAPEEIKLNFRKKCNEQFEKNNTYNIPAIALLNSNYIYYSYFKYRALSIINSGKVNESLVFDLVKQRTQGKIRDKIIIFLLLNSSKTSDARELYDEAKQIIHDEISKRILNSLLKMAPGKPFFNFSLVNLKGKTVKFADFKNKTVLIDFWFYGCGGCAKFYQNTLRHTEEVFEGDNSVVFLSVNCDLSKIRWVGGIKEGIYTSGDAVNLNTDGFGTNHPLNKALDMSFCPFVVLINKDGTIKYLNSENLYDVESLNAAIKSIE